MGKETGRSDKFERVSEARVRQENEKGGRKRADCKRTHEVGIRSKFSGGARELLAKRYGFSRELSRRSRAAPRRRCHATAFDLSGREPQCHATTLDFSGRKREGVRWSRSKLAERGISVARGFLGNGHERSALKQRWVGTRHVNRVMRWFRGRDTRSESKTHAHTVGIQA